MKVIKLCEGAYMVMWEQTVRFSGRDRTVSCAKVVYARSKHRAVMSIVNYERERTNASR